MTNRETGQPVRFGVKEWVGLCSLAFVVLTVTLGGQFYVVSNVSRLTAKVESNEEQDARQDQRIDRVEDQLWGHD